MDDKYFPKALKTRKNLGCDMDSFDIVVGHKDGMRNDTIYTGSDGFYGDAFINKVPFGFMINLYLDADFVCERQIKASLAHLFKCKELGRCGNTVCQLSLSGDGKTRNARLQIPYRTTLDAVKEILQSESLHAHKEPDKLLDKVCRRYGWKWIKADPLPDTPGVVMALN